MNNNKAALPAAIVIGSNSTRLLYALPDGKKVRGRLETRLMQALDGGSLSKSGIQQAAEDVNALSLQAKGAGFLDVRVFATSAARDASNQKDLLEAIFQKTGLKTTVWSGQEEANYSFLGAVEDVHQTEGTIGVLDIGGGSSEVVIGTNQGLQKSTSLQLGASRLLHTNPINGKEDIVPAAEKVASVLSDVSLVQAACWVLIGGTGTALARVHLGMAFDAALLEGGIKVPLEAAKELLYRLADMPRESRANIIGVPPTRIDIFPTGLVILLCLAQRFEIHSLIISENTNADGYLYSL